MKFYDPERFTRFDAMIIVICIAVIFAIWQKIDDLFGLFILAGIVIAIAILLYLPRMSLSIIGFAGCAFLFGEANKIQHWQMLVPCIFLGFFALCSLVYYDNKLILQRLDAVHKKVDGLQEKLEEIEAKQDEID